MRRKSGRAGALLLAFMLAITPLQTWAAAEESNLPETVIVSADEKEVFEEDTNAENEAETKISEEIDSMSETEETDTTEETEIESDVEISDETESESDAVIKDKSENESVESTIEWYQDNLQGISTKVEGTALQEEPQMLVTPELGGMFIDPKLYGIHALVDGAEAKVIIASVVDSEGNELPTEEVEEYGQIIPYENLVHEEKYLVVYGAEGTEAVVTKQFTAFLQVDQAYEETDLDPNVKIIRGGMDFGNTYHTLIYNNKATISSWMKRTDCAEVTKSGDSIQYVITSNAAKNNIGFDLKKILYDPFLEKYYDLHITIEDYGYSKGTDRYSGGYPSLKMEASGEIWFDEKGPTIALRYQILDSVTGQEYPGDYIFSFWGINRNQKFFFDTSAIVDGIYQTQDSYVDMYTDYPVLNGAYRADMYFTSSETDDLASDSAVCATVRQVGNMVYGIVGTNERGSVFYQSSGTRNQRHTSVSFYPIAGAKEPILKKGASLSPVNVQNFTEVFEKSESYHSENPLMVKYNEPCYYAFLFDTPSAEDYSYQSYVISDTLPQGMEYMDGSVKIYDVGADYGADVTTLFAIKEKDGTLQISYQPGKDSGGQFSNSCYLAVFEVTSGKDMQMDSVCNQGNLKSTNGNGKYSFSYDVDSGEVYTKLDVDSIPPEDLKEWLYPLSGCDYQTFKANFTEEEWELLAEKIGFDEEEFYAQETCHTLELVTADQKMLLVTINATKRALSQQSLVTGSMMSEEDLAQWSLEDKVILAGVKLEILKPCGETTLEGNQVQVQIEGTKYLTSKLYDATKLEVYEAEGEPVQVEADAGANDVCFETGALTYLFAVPDEIPMEEELQIYLTAKDNGNETVDLDWSSYNGLDTDMFRAFDSLNTGTDWETVQLTADVMNTGGGSGSVTMSELFNGWSRVGATGEWGLQSHEGTTVLVNKQNTDYFTGFYNPESKLKKAVSWHINYQSKNYDADDDVIGCLIKFNLTGGSSDGQDGTAKICTSYLFLQDAGGWGNIGGIYRMDQKKMSELNQTTSLTQIGTVKSTYGSDKHWSRDKWSSYEIICTEENEFFVYQDGVLICHCQDTSSQAIQMGTFGLINLSQPAYFKNFSYSYTRYLDRTDATVVAEDFEAPDRPELIDSKLSVMEIAANDNGTPYSYLVKAYDENDLTTVKIASNTPDLTITQGIRGYYYYLDNLPTGTAETNHTYAEGTSLLFDAQKDNPNGFRYLHVAAVDASENRNLGATADFELNQYTIHTEAEHGTITESITGTMYFDAVISYEAEEGYQLSEILVDGVPVKIDNFVDRYEFTDVTEDHTIKVFYSRPELAKMVSYEGGDHSIQDQVLAYGDRITYTLSYKNTTDSTRTMVISDTIPEGMELIPESLEEEIPDGITIEQTGRVIQWTVSRVKAKEEGSVSFSVKVLSSAQGKELKNTASLTSHALNNSHSEQDVTVVSDEIANTVLSDPVEVIYKDGQNVCNGILSEGESAAYAVIFKNPAEVEKEAIVRLVLPEGVDYISSSENGIYQEESRTIVWTLTDVPPQEYSEVEVNVKVNASAKDSILLSTAEVTIDEATLSARSLDGYEGEDPIPSEQEGAAVYISSKHIYNEKDKRIDEQTVVTGDTIRYGISYGNTGLSTQNLIIRDTLPAGVTFVQASAQGTYEEKNGMITWKLSSKAGEQGEVFVTVQVKNDCGSQITNRAVLEMTEPISGRRSETEVKISNPVTKKKHSSSKENPVTSVPTMLLPLTGDNNYTLFYIALIVLSLGAVAAFLWDCRKKK